MATKIKNDDGELRRRSPTIVPSLSESSISDYEDNQPLYSSTEGPSTQSNDTITLHRIFTSTTFQKRLSRQSSLSWGYRPSRIVGASCLLFMLPIPLLVRACCPISAALLGCVTVSSYLSDHVYTGLESWAHFFDRVLAPMAFTSCVYATYTTCGIYWVLLSLAALKCHMWSNYYSKQGMYEKYVLWHSLWHAV